MNLLFICSRNQWRSRTAETIFRDEPVVDVKSAGTEKSARIRLTRKLIDWADIIFVMENKHQSRVLDLYGEMPDTKKIIVLDIPDHYQYMDEELIGELRDVVAFYLND